MVAVLADYVAIKVDGSESPDVVEKEMTLHDVAAFPTIVFVDKDGNTLDTPRVTEFVPPEKFVELVPK